MAASLREHFGKQGFSGRAFAKGLLILATCGTLTLPVILPYARAIADALLSLIALLFLISRYVESDWDWLNAPHTWVMLVLWTRMLFCKLVAPRVQTIEQAMAALRFVVFTAALESWVLADPRSRRRLWYVVLGAAIWIMLECWQQYLFGASVLGYRRYIDGALTGPFQRPIAGGTYLAVLFPAILPLCFMLLRRGRFDWLYAIGALAFAAATRSVNLWSSSRSNWKRFGRHRMARFSDER